MRLLKSCELRKLFLDFFHERAHAIIPSSSLIPENDPTVLFTTAGMHPLVPYLMGEKHPGGTRLADVQKCIRTGDIDEVGDSSIALSSKCWVTGPWVTTLKKNPSPFPGNFSPMSAGWGLTVTGFSSPASRVTPTRPGTPIPTTAG